MSEADLQSVEPTGSFNEYDRRQSVTVGGNLDEVTARKILDTIRASRDFIEEAELAKQCRAVVEFYQEKGNFQGIVDAYSLIGTLPLSIQDAYALSVSLAQTGNLERARTVIASIAWKDREDLKLTSLGKLLIAQGKELDAKAHFTAALKINAGNQEAMAELSLRWPEDEALLLAKGEALRLQGKSEEASKTFEKLLEKGEESPEVLRSAGIAMADARHFEDAEKLLEKAASRGDDAEAMLALGLVQIERNEVEAGVRNIEEGLRKGAGRKPEVIKRLAIAYAEQGENKKAVDAVDFVLKEWKQDEGEKKAFELRLLETSKNHGNNSTRLVAAEKLLSGDETSRIFQAEKIDALNELGRYEEALSFLDGHRQIDNYHERRMDILRRSGRLQDAESEADQLLKRDARNQEALFTKLQAANEKGEGRKALRQYEKTVLRHGGEKLLKLHLEIAKRCREDLMVVRACQALISSGKSTINILGDRAVAVERLGRTAQSMKYLRKLYRRNRNVESLELLTSFYARHGKGSEEERLLAEAHATMELPIGLLERLAKLKMDRGEEAEALSIIASAIEKKETPEGRYLEAEVLLKTGKMEDALKAVGRAMQLGYPGKIGEFLAGRAEEAAGHFESALQRYNRSIGYGLSTPDIFLSRVNIYKQMGKAAEAKEEMQSIEKLFAHDSLVQGECIEFYFSTGMYQQCIETAERLIKSDRNNEKAWKKRGLSLLAIKRYDDAITSLEAALKINRDSDTVAGLKEAYNAKGDRKSIIRTIDMLLEFKGTDKKLLLEKGDVLADIGRPEEAMSAYQAAMDRFGQDEDAVIRKAGILHAKKDYQDELELLIEFLKKDDKKPALLSMVSRAYLAIKRYSDALEYADRAMQLEPDNIKHLDLRAEILSSLGRYDEAERSVDIALSVSPKDPDALEIKGNVLMKDGRYSQALELLNGALSAGICNPQIYRNRGECLMKLERHSEALDSFTKALKDEPENPGILLGKGICELTLGRYSSATLSLNELTKRDPENGSGWYYFAMALKNQKVLSEAKRAFSEAVRLDDTLDRAWHELAEMHMSAGDLDEAERAYEKSLEYSPADNDSREGLETCRNAKGRQRAEGNAIALLKLEYELNRNPTKEEAFSVCRIPMDEIDIAFDLVNEPTTLAVPSSGEKGWKEVEDRSASVLSKCFKNRETASYGVRLCDIVYNFPSLTLDEAKQLFEYIAKIQKLSVIDAIEDEKFERLLKKATKLRQADRSLIGIITNLGVGIYIAKLLESSLAAMGQSGYTTDFVSFSAEPPEEESTGQPEAYDPYEVRRQLYDQFYGGETPQPAEEEGSTQRCLYHGEDAIGACSSCQTNICNSCLSATDGHCPNCGVVLLSDEAGSTAA